MSSYVRSKSNNVLIPSLASLLPYAVTIGKGQAMGAVRQETGRAREIEVINIQPSS